MSGLATILPECNLGCILLSMNPNMRKSLLTIAGCFGFAVIACDTPILCQTSATSAVITDVEANRYIGLRIGVHAKDAPIVIPTCGSDTESDEHHVCGLASQLQVRTAKGWRSVSVRKGLAGVLGGIAKDKWAPLLIAQGDTAYFTLTIDPSFLDVRTGDRLRVELDTWPNEAAMRTTEPEKKLRSPTFICP
jgi:hypothetical protein